MIVALPVLGAVTVAASACGSTHQAASSTRTPYVSPAVVSVGRAIASAKHATGFAQFSDIFPSTAGTVPCSVQAGPPSNVFKGRCSVAVMRGADRGAKVVFTQDFGSYGPHRWVVRVSGQGTAQLISQSGRGLVQLIP